MEIKKIKVRVLKQQQVDKDILQYSIDIWKEKGCKRRDGLDQRKKNCKRRQSQWVFEVLTYFISVFIVEDNAVWVSVKKM